MAGSGGWIGKLWEMIGGAFGGFKATGGPLAQNKWYIAGERGPEPIWGGGPGAFAAGYGGGMNVTVVNNNHFHEVRDVTDAKMAAAGSQISDATLARVREEKRRGRL
jgi:hypothetical protein